MNAVNKHIIRTQKVEVEFNNPKDAFACKTQLAEACKHKLIPAMESVMDDYLNEEYLVSIQKLTLDVGVISAENWAPVFVEKVIEQLQNFLKKHIASQYNGKQKESIQKLREESFDTELAISVEGLLIKKRVSESSAILFYLKEGRFPWNTTITGKNNLKKEVLKTIEKNLVFQQELISLLHSDKIVLKRWIYLFSEKESTQVLKKNAWSEEIFLKALKDWQKLLPQLSKSLQYTLYLKAMIELTKTSDPKPNMLSERFSHEMVNVLKNEMPDIYTQVMNTAPFKEMEQRNNSAKKVEIKDKEEITKEDADQVDSLRERPKKEIDKMEENGMENKEIQAAKDFISKKSLDQKRIKETLKKEKNDEVQEVEPVYIANSGLVLLHPFLSNLFKNLGYNEKGKWISIENQERALLLTQYLTTGKQDFTEHDLFLNKILCGYPLEEPVPLEIELSKAEKQETNDLLNSVIQHWSALKNTSVEGLQTTFLQRPGKISPITSGWLLQVEQKGVDILLDKIPWGFATVKTPWMKELISVEWA